MKKIIGVITVLLLMLVSGFGQSANQKQILEKVEQFYENADSISGNIDISMLMMGNKMTIPGKFWKKGKQFRMEMVMQQPGMAKPMEQIIVSNGKMIWQYQKTMNMVTIIDIEKLPKEIRDQMQNQGGGFSMGEDLGKQLSQIQDKCSISEKIQKGKKYYVVAIDNISDIANNLPMNSKQKLQGFGKMTVWIDAQKYYISKIEVYGESEQPGMTVEFSNLKVGPIKDSLFTFTVPENAQVINMTEMMKNMAGATKQEAVSK